MALIFFVRKLVTLADLSQSGRASAELAIRVLERADWQIVSDRVSERRGGAERRSGEIKIWNGGKGELTGVMLAGRHRDLFRSGADADAHTLQERSCAFENREIFRCTLRWWLEKPLCVFFSLSSFRASTFVYCKVRATLAEHEQQGQVEGGRLG